RPSTHATDHLVSLTRKRHCPRPLGGRPRLRARIRRRVNIFGVHVGVTTTRAGECRMSVGTARLVGTMRREFLDHVLFWNARDLERKLAAFQAYYNAARSHPSLEGHTPLAFGSGQRVAPGNLNHVRWVSH